MKVWVIFSELFGVGESMCIQLKSSGFGGRVVVFVIIFCIIGGYLLRTREACRRSRIKFYRKAGEFRCNPMHFAIWSLYSLIIFRNVSQR